MPKPVAPEAAEATLVLLSKTQATGRGSLEEGEIGESVFQT